MVQVLFRTVLFYGISTFPGPSLAPYLHNHDEDYLKLWLRIIAGVSVLCLLCFASTVGSHVVSHTLAGRPDHKKGKQE